MLKEHCCHSNWQGRPRAASGPVNGVEESPPEPDYRNGQLVNAKVLFTHVINFKEDWYVCVGGEAPECKVTDLTWILRSSLQCLVPRVKWQPRSTRASDGMLA